MNQLRVATVLRALLVVTEDRDRMLRENTDAGWSARYTKRCRQIRKFLDYLEREFRYVFCRLPADTE